MYGKLKIFWAYLRARLKLIALLCAFCALFAAVFSLYRLPVEAVLYAAGLCTAFGAVAAAADFLHFYRRHRLLCDLVDKIAVSCDGLPEPDNLIEADILALVQAACAARQKLLGEAEKEKREIIDYYTMWVHQIKTPIAAAKLILADEETAESRELRTQLFRIEQYVEMVLVYLRMGSDSTDYVLRECALIEVVRQAARKYAPLFIRNKTALDLRPLDTRVLTDEKWLCFCIEQILSNAVKYAPGGKVSIFAVGDTLVINDNGIGIMPEDLPRIFERGFTGYNGRTDKKATGIGLYLTKQILTKLGHAIQIDSAPEKGTTVKIDLSAKPRDFE